MTPQALIRQTTALFLEAGIPDPAWDSALLLAHLTGKPALNLRLDMDTQLDDDLLAQYIALRDQRLQRVPLQYLTHEQSFMGHTFYVDERVLIPRPETELLTELAIAELRRMAAPTALDMCCGSGCISISIALAVPGAQVHAADLSPDALAVTRRNADALGANITLHQGDLFASVEGLRFDLIISNPPYIPTQDCRTLQTEVMQEPGMALDGGADGYDFYRRIALESPAHLNPGGVVLLEVGFDQANHVAELMQQAGFRQTEIHQDLQGIPRMVVAHL
ncbi:MAG: peptide chain release factor N(5)-glutamine methyltransferase [Clostridia bacterium]|nr:peptide chain release factor N(5)-glutamine methyltransferase [Clostridia bacterium]